MSKKAELPEDWSNKFPAPAEQRRDLLKPCPFCGGKAVLTDVRMSGHTFKVGCYNELCWRPGTDGFNSYQAAIDAWNTRIPSPDERPHAENCNINRLHDPEGRVCNCGADEQRAPRDAAPWCHICGTWHPPSGPCNNTPREAAPCPVTAQRVREIAADFEDWCRESRELLLVANWLEAREAR